MRIKTGVTQATYLIMARDFLMEEWLNVEVFSPVLNGISSRTGAFIITQLFQFGCFGLGLSLSSTVLLSSHFPHLNLCRAVKLDWLATN